MDVAAKGVSGAFEMIGQERKAMMKQAKQPNKESESASDKSSSFVPFPDLQLTCHNLPIWSSFSHRTTPAPT